MTIRSGSVMTFTTDRASGRKGRRWRGIGVIRLGGESAYLSPAAVPTRVATQCAGEPSLPCRLTHVDHAREGIGTHRLPHQRGEPLGALAEVHRLRRHHHPDRAGRRSRDEKGHDTPFKAPITATTKAGDAPSPIRTVTPAASTSIAAPAAFQAGPRFGRPGLRGLSGFATLSASGPGATTAGTKASASASARLRASGAR